MPINDLDDATADALLSGRFPVRRGDRDDTVALDGLADLVATIRSAGSARPRPHVLLAEVLEDGVAALEPAPASGVPNAVASATEEGPASATGTAAPHAPNPPHREVAAPTAAGLRGRPRVRELVAAKLAALGFAAKFGAGSVAVLAATAGAGTVGALPGPVQEGFGAISALEAPVSAQGDEPPPAGSTAASDTDPERRSTSDERPGIEGPEVADEARSEEPGVDGPTIASQASNLRSEWGRKLADLARSAADERRPGHASERASDARRSGEADNPGAPDNPRAADNAGTPDNPGTADNPGAADDPGASGSTGNPGRSEGPGQEGHTFEAPPEEQGPEEEAGEDPDEDPDENEGSEQPPEQAPGSDARP